MAVPPAASSPPGSGAAWQRQSRGRRRETRRSHPVMSA